MSPGRTGGVGGEFSLPVGTVTFLLTDVEGSTTGWQATPEAMGPAIARHYAILDAAVSAHGGVRPQEQGEGDSIVAAFGRATDALKAAIDAQHAFATEPWPPGLAKPLRIRMAIHTGEAQTRNEANYVGQAIIRTARLRAIAHGGQILVSQAVRDLVIDQLGAQIELLDLGLHRLKDLARPEHVWQIATDHLDRDFPPLRSLDATPNNLPIELSTFIGRHAEIESVSALTTTQRLVTITGAGGAGKTRLAQQVAANIADHYPDGTWWIELAPIDATAVRTTIANVLSITEPDRLVERLHGTTLLVLDNCEHVLDAITPLVHQIITKCPGITILATSRGPLDVPGEITWRLPPLAVPEPNGVPLPIESLAQYDAVQLFLDRARRARPNFTLATANGPAIAELCHRLDGIPLAIELAAARTKSLTAEQILTGLDDALRLLTGGSRLAMPRQQTLEASITWSVNLLGPDEQSLLRRLSVFAGGCDLEAAEAICADDTLQPLHILNALEHLIDQSLVRVDEQHGHARYHLLETVRQYADHQLEDAERGRIKDSHAGWYARLAAEVGPLVEGPAQLDCVALLAPDHDNFAAALSHLRTGDDIDAFVQMILDLGPYWDMSEHPAVGRTWTTNAIDFLGQTRAELRARLHEARTVHMYRTGVVMGIGIEAGIALRLAEQVGDVRTAGRARVFQSIGVAWLNIDAGIAGFDVALAESEAAGDAYGCARNLGGRVNAYFIPGYLRPAREALARSESAIRAVGNPGLLDEWNSMRIGIANVHADHLVMRAAMDATAATALTRSDIAAGLRLNLVFHLRTDFGDDLPDPMIYAEEGRRLEQAENHFSAIGAKTALAEVLLRRGDLHGALAVADALPLGVLPGTAGHILGARVCLALHDLDGAQNRLNRAMAAPSAKSNPRLIIDIDLVTALIARADGDLAAADAAAHHALTTALDTGLVREPISILEVLAGLAVAHGAWSHAVRLAGAAQEVRDTHPLRDRPEPFASMLSADLAAARAALGDEAYDAAFAEGRLLDRETAVEFAQRMRGERTRPTVGWNALTPTERRVADLARLGHSNAEIAKQLLMGLETVKSHLSRSYAKLGVATRTQLAALPPPPVTV